MIRLRSLRIEHFKNVTSGQIDIPDTGLEASILGVYGQNGSGKTAIVEALECLKQLLAEGTLPLRAMDFVEMGFPHALIEAKWHVSPSSILSLGILSYNSIDEEGVYGENFFDDLGNLGCDITYSVQIGKVINEARVLKESIICKVEGWKERTLITHAYDIVCDEDQVHGILPGVHGINFESAPRAKWASMRAIDKAAKKLYENVEYMQFNAGESFIFSEDFDTIMSIIGRRSNELRDSGELSASASNAVESILKPLYTLSGVMKRYARSKLYVESTFRSNAIGLDTLIIDMLPHGESDYSPQSGFILSANQPTKLPIPMIEELGFTLKAINEVVDKLVPGLQLTLKDLGPTVLESGDEARNVLVMANRDSVEIPLYCESEGIKKLVTVLSMLIMAYNDDEVCVVIDELDASIFEFLLGELLDALSRHGRGQLIFTAHNLRPMETLPYRSIAVTTVNPNDRYIKFQGVKPSNNMRDLYLRTINLGGEKWNVYNPTDILSISGALYDAAHPLNEDFDSFEAALKGRND